MEGYASVYRVYAVSRTTSEKRAECSKGWKERGRGGVCWGGGEGIANSFRSHRRRDLLLHVALGLGGGSGGREGGGVWGREGNELELRHGWLEI